MKESFSIDQSPPPYLASVNILSKCTDLCIVFYFILLSPYPPVGGDGVIDFFSIAPLRKFVKFYLK
jgi:hypothetical protein